MNKEHSLNTKPVLLINGKIGSGKDTTSEIIASLVDEPVYYKPFAYKLKQIVEILSGVKMVKTSAPYANEVYNYTQEQKNLMVKTFNMTIGQMLQKIGTEVFRNSFDQNTWVKALFNDFNGEQIWICNDTRFINEISYLDTLDLPCIKIRIEGDPAGIRASSNRDLNHISETALDDYNHFDYIIKNTNSLINLKDTIKNILTENNFKLK